MKEIEIGLYDDLSKFTRAQLSEWVALMDEELVMYMSDEGPVRSPDNDKKGMIGLALMERMADEVRRRDRLPSAGPSIVAWEEMPDGTRFRFRNPVYCF